MACTRRLRELVVEPLPGCTESVGGAKTMGYAPYWERDRQDVLAMISPEDTHIKLYLHHVRSDPSPRLRVEGPGKNARHVKLQLDGDRDEAAIRDVLRLAARRGA